MFNKLKREELELEKKITQQNHELEVKQIALNFALNFVHKANFDTNEILSIALKAEQFLNGK